MAKLFFCMQGETIFVELSPHTHERLRKYVWKSGASLNQIVELVHARFGEVSEELVIRYLDTFE